MDKQKYLDKAIDYLNDALCSAVMAQQALIKCGLPPKPNEYDATAAAQRALQEALSKAGNYKFNGD